MNNLPTDQYRDVEGTFPRALQKQAADIWASLVPLIRERSVAEGVDGDAYGRRLADANELLLDLELALNDQDFENVNSRPPIPVWFHRRPEHVAGTAKIEQEEIKRDMLLDATAKYLSRTWLQHPEIDWILLDALIFAEVTAYRESVMSGAAIGTANWAYVFSGGDIQKTLYLRLAGAIAGLAARYLLPIALIWGLIYSGREGAAIATGAVYGLYLLSRLFSWPNRRAVRRKIRDASSLLEKMQQAYGYVSPPIVNPSILRGHLDDVTKAGARFDGAVFALLDRITGRDSSTFLPFALR